jgi:hypothetical protein
VNARYGQPRARGNRRSAQDNDFVCRFCSLLNVADLRSVIRDHEFLRHKLTLHPHFARRNSCFDDLGCLRFKPIREGLNSRVNACAVNVTGHLRSGIRISSRARIANGATKLPTKHWHEGFINRQGRLLGGGRTSCLGTATFICWRT